MGTPKAINIPDTQRLPIDQLKADGKNPNKMSDKEFNALKANFKRYGFLVPIITNKEMLIADGEHRWRAARELGMKEVPVVVLDVDEVDRRMLRQILNKLRGQHEPEKDLEEYQYLMSQNELNTLAELSAQEPSKLLKLMDANDEYEIDNDFDMDTVYKGKPLAKKGQLWKLGNHYLAVGDSTLEETYRAFPVKTFNITFTDPPWNVKYDAINRPIKKTKRAKGTILNDDLSAKAYREFIRKSTAQIVKRTEGSIYICMGSKSLPILMQEMAVNGAHWSSTIIWAKNCFTLSRKDYQLQYEALWYGWKEGAKHKFYGGRNTSDFWEQEPAPKKRKKKRQGDIWRHNKPSRSPNHPTTKPLELVRHAILDSTLKGETVLDIFGGSGSTIIACEQTGRTCYTIELDPHYATVIIKRWEHFTRRKAHQVKQ